MRNLLKDREIRDIIVGRLEDSKHFIDNKNIIQNEILDELKRDLQSIIELIDELRK